MSYSGNDDMGPCKTIPPRKPSGATAPSLAANTKCWPLAIIPASAPAPSHSSPTQRITCSAGAASSAMATQSPGPATLPTAASFKTTPLEIECGSVAIMNSRSGSETLFGVIHGLLYISGITHVLQRQRVAQSVRPVVSRVRWHHVDRPDVSLHLDGSGPRPGRLSLAGSQRRFLHCPAAARAQTYPRLCTGSAGRRPSHG